ncbi:MAG: hypothetical protein OXI77_12385 [Chloroflexota bacterium]|nr:hypothetical protein [Chloroflexota bacterium]MDE2909176.1 hypothetical protein [Chloroflexota bacterium]
MDLVYLTQEALEALQPSTLPSARIIDHEEARSIRRKLLGVLIRKRRLEAERSLGECAKFMGAEPGLVEDWEYGDSEPSLPQLELLGRFFNGRATHAGGAAPVEDKALQEEYMLLRQRLIGAMLRAARESSGKSLDELSASAGMESLQLEKFEFGEVKIPISSLTALAQALQLDMRYFEASPQDSREQPQTSRVLELADEAQPDWRDFAAESGNLPFIRLAMAFQHMARADLHRIAEALVAIIRANGEAKGLSGSPT